MDNYLDMNSLNESSTALIEKLENLLTLLPLMPQKRHEVKDALFCIKLFMAFYAEAYKAVKAGAWFAAASVSGAALEAMLMARCLFSADSVKSLPKWQHLHKNHKGDFQVFIRSMDLGKLLEIGEQLCWFQSGDALPQQFLKTMSAFVSENDLKGIQSLFRGARNIGQLCATYVREHRNLLHPAVCLKEGREPSTEAGMAATMMFLIACTALQETTLA